MSQVLNLVLFGPFLARYATVLAKIRAFGEDEKPHRVETLGTG